MGGKFRAYSPVQFLGSTSAFQIQVWEALKKIPIGTTVHYSDIAGMIGQPTSVRAVARACATNPIALLVPCHRVTPKSGGLGGYRWGVDRKCALLDLEKRATNVKVRGSSS